MPAFKEVLAVANVFDTVVRNELCIGCGLCAALCPQNILTVRWNKYGEYNAAEISPCTTECGMCLDICPFADSEENEDAIGKRLYGDIPGIQHKTETGYYLSSYVGYSDEHRPTSASGGFVTWLLESLLTEKIIDYAICVTPTGRPDKLFSFQIYDKPEMVRNGSGSSYYPVEMSEVIGFVLDNPGRYAVTGLPCFIKALRLGQRKSRKLNDRIIVTIGLVCGQLKSRHFTEYIATLAESGDDVSMVRYRTKSLLHPTSNFSFTFTTSKGKQSRIFWNDGISEAWTNRWFTPMSCNYCDDIFAECADVTCMDAWLPEYSQDRDGTGLALVRLPLLKDMFEHGRGIVAKPVPVEKVTQSQEGVISVKREQLAYRLHMNPQAALQKRVSARRPLNPLIRLEVELKEHMRALSHESWINGGSLQEEFEPHVSRLKIMRMVSAVLAMPFKAHSLIRERIRS